MRLILLGLGFASCLAAGATAAADRRLQCLSSGEAIEAVSSRQVVAPGRAIVAARGAAPGAEILRAALCRDGEGLAYMVTALRKDGRLVRVIVEASSGKIKSVH